MNAVDDHERLASELRARGVVWLLNEANRLARVLVPREPRYRIVVDPIATVGDDNRSAVAVTIPAASHLAGVRFLARSTSVGRSNVDVEALACLVIAMRAKVAAQEVTP